MVRTSEVGSTTIVSFQTKYPTFSPVDLEKTMAQFEFQRGAVPMTQAGGQTEQIFYSKDNTTIDVDWQNQILNFRFFNKINIVSVQDIINKILLQLKIDPSSISLMGVDCRTMAHDIGIPSDNLTSLISKESKSRLAKIYSGEPAVFSVVLMNKNPQEEDLQIRIEPLLSNPQESFFIHLNYRTKIHEKFDAFIVKFGENLIKDIAESVCVQNAGNN